MKGWLRRATTHTTSEPDCTCGHPHQAHQHYRPGTDCSQCLCPAYGRLRRKGGATR